MSDHPNPFYRLCGSKHPHASSHTICAMEEAWDAAITAVLALKNSKGNIRIGDIKRIKSTNQRSNGPMVPLQSDIDCNSLLNVKGPAIDRMLTPEQKREVIGLRNENNRIHAIKRVREIAGVGLKEAKDYVFDYLGTPDRRAMV